MAEVNVKQQHTHSVDPLQIKEEPGPRHIKEEPEEFPFRIITVKTEDDEDKPSVLHQKPTEKNREETHGSSSDTDDSEGYSQQQAPAKRSYAMVAPDSSVTAHTPFSCSECGRSFMTKTELKVHLRVHSGERPYKCLVCEKSFKQKSHITKHEKLLHHICPVCKTRFPDKMKLNEHLRTHVEEGTLGLSFMKSYSYPRPFSCTDCGKSFASDSVLQSHRSLHSGQGPHKCSVCEKTFVHGGYLKIHMRFHTGEKPFVCPVCEKGFVNTAGLTRHQRDVHHICPVCSERLTDRFNLNEHLRSHVEEGTLDRSSLLFREIIKPFSCSDCGKSFACNSSLQSHRLVHTEKGPHKSSVCEKTFSQKGYLKAHMEIHTGEKPFVCLDCDKGFVQTRGLTRHRRHVHHICPVCSDRLTDKNSLNEHLRTHVEEGILRRSSSLYREIFKPFSCSVCGKSFSLKSQLQSHMSAHTEVKPHKCSVCAKGFKEIRYLTEHQKQAHHFCPVCETCFSKKIKLNEHLKTHVEDESPEQFIIKSFSCSDCEKSFACSDDLKTHMKIHAGGKPFVCPDCGKGFTKDSGLTRHQRDFHQLCPVCSERLTDRNSLREHLRSHVEDGALKRSSSLFREMLKSFRCSECGKSFRSRSHLQSHMFVHTKARPHKCSVCEASFKETRRLSEHLKRVHFFCPACETYFAEKIDLNEHLRTHVEGTLDRLFSKTLS